LNFSFVFPAGLEVLARIKRISLWAWFRLVVLRLGGRERKMGLLDRRRRNSGRERIVIDMPRSAL
jgi:hypothetical protein